MRCINGDRFPTDIEAILRVVPDFDAVVIPHTGHIRCWNALTSSTGCLGWLSETLRSHKRIWDDRAGTLCLDQARSGGGEADRTPLRRVRRVLRRSPLRQHSRQKPEFGIHIRGVGYGIGDFLAKEFTIPLAKPVNRDFERSR